MGNLINNRQNLRVEEIDVASNHVYKYPPRSGNYFGSQFIMGGDRFDTPQPEAYLFGENADLNFLGHRPTPFPYPPPPGNEPTKTLKSLINIRKESVRFVRLMEASEDASGEGEHHNTHDTKFNIEFVFDADARSCITVLYFCTEEVTSSGVTYTSKLPAMSSETFHYPRGANQLFSQPTLTFDPSKFPEGDLQYDIDKEIIPIVIHCVAEEGLEGEPKQSHSTFCVVDKHTDGTFVLRALKQKLFVDGLSYLLQEIYGIENKNNEKTLIDEETEENGAECVICMCDVRDTLILPCKHLCLCNSCADSLRYQANNCPICRAPFRALLQIRALQKSPFYSVSNTQASEENEQIPPGYEAVSLVEALNGPYTVRHANTNLELSESPDSETTVQAAEMLNRQSTNEDEKISPKDGSSPEYRLSVILSGSDSVLRKSFKKDNKLTKNKVIDQEREEEKVPTECDQSNDNDSDAEKLSPLLVVKTRINAGDVEDNGKQSSDSEKRKISGNPDDSDYYTPDDPHPSPLYDNNLKDDNKSVESTPEKQSNVTSVPGTPLSQISQVSGRSSGDSYSSTSSTTKLLLAHNIENQNVNNSSTLTASKSAPSARAILKE